MKIHQKILMFAIILITVSFMGCSAFDPNRTQIHGPTEGNGKAIPVND